MHKFNVGDVVIITNTKERGSIVKINALLGENENLYEVNVGSSIRLYRESYLELFISKDYEDVRKSLKNLDLKKLNQDLLRENFVTDIINKLNLQSSNDTFINLANACNLAKYLVLNDVKINDIKTNNQSVINSYIFSKVLNAIDMDVVNVKLDSIDNDFYVANLVLIGDSYYYFDITLEKELYEKMKDTNSLLLSSEGIGKKHYEEYYKPIGVIDLINNQLISKIPNNISVEDIDSVVINNMIGEKIEDY